MRKDLTVLLFLIMLLLTACGEGLKNSTPEEAAQSFMRILANKDVKKIPDIYQDGGRYDPLMLISLFEDKGILEIDPSLLDYEYDDEYKRVTVDYANNGKCTPIRLDVVETNQGYFIIDFKFSFNKDCVYGTDFPSEEQEQVTDSAALEFSNEPSSHDILDNLQWGMTFDEITSLFGLDFEDMSPEEDYETLLYKNLPHMFLGYRASVTFSLTKDITNFSEEEFQGLLDSFLIEGDEEEINNFVKDGLFDDYRLWFMYFHINDLDVDNLLAKLHGRFGTPTKIEEHSNEYQYFWLLHDRTHIDVSITKGHPSVYVYVMSEFEAIRNFKTAQPKSDIY